MLKNKTFIKKLSKTFRPKIFGLRRFKKVANKQRVLTRGDRSLRVVIVARANCEPLDKRLLICHYSKPTKAEDFRPKRLAKLFDKRFVLNVFYESESYTF